MGAKKGRKVVQAINLNPDVRELLRKQAKATGVSISTYVERLILEKSWKSQNSAGSAFEEAQRLEAQIDLDENETGQGIVDP